MSINQVSIKYARALCAVAKGRNQLELIETELAGVAKLLKDNADFSLVFFNPGISARKKCRIFDAVFEGCTDTLVAFLKILAEKRREECFDDIVRLFRAYSNEERNILIAQLITAEKISDAQVANIAAKIKNQTGKTAVIEQYVNRSVIGGFALRVNDVRYDGTIKRRLDDMKALMTGK